MTVLRRIQKALATFVEEKALGAFVEEGPSGLRAWNERRVSGRAKTGVRVRATLTMWEWDQPEGPRLALEGTVGLDRLQAQLTFRRSDPEAGESRETTEVGLVPELERIGMPRAVADAGMGADPFVWVKFIDGRGRALSHEIYLGRSSREAVTVEAHLNVAAEAILWLTAADCSDPRGPVLDVAGELRYVDGITASFQLRNYKNPNGESFRSRTVEVTVLPAGVGMPFQPQRIAATSGGGPSVSVRFTDMSGQALGEELPIGRCVQLPSASS